MPHNIWKTSQLPYRSAEHIKPYKTLNLAMRLCSKFLVKVRSTGPIYLLVVLILVDGIALTSGLGIGFDGGFDFWTNYVHLKLIVASFFFALCIWQRRLWSFVLLLCFYAVSSFYDVAALLENAGQFFGSRLGINFAISDTVYLAIISVPLISVLMLAIFALATVFILSILLVAVCKGDRGIQNYLPIFAIGFVAAGFIIIIVDLIEVTYNGASRSIIEFNGSITGRGDLVISTLVLVFALAVYIRAAETYFESNTDDSI